MKKKEKIIKKIESTAKTYQDDFGEPLSIAPEYIELVRNIKSSTSLIDLEEKFKSDVEKLYSVKGKIDPVALEKELYATN